MLFFVFFRCCCGGGGCCVVVLLFLQGPMPTASLGPMPSSAGKEEGSEGALPTLASVTSSASASTTGTLPTKKIPRKKKEAGGKGSMLMPSSVRR